jgi:hypothetical protein
MKKTVISICSFLLLTTCLSAQKSEPVTVKAGTRVEDYFPFQERYRYPEFIDGKVFFRNGAYAATKLNYNFLIGEMEYIQLKDTLSLDNTADIMLIAIAKDTFYYDKGYLEQIFNGQVKVALKQYIKLKEVQKKDSYGSSGSNSATDSYSTIQTAGQTYKLVINQDRVFQKMSEFYLATPSSGFVPFSKKKVMQLFPRKKDAIQDYLKSNKVDFDSREELIRFAEYLVNL